MEAAPATATSSATSTSTTESTVPPPVKTMRALVLEDFTNPAKFKEIPIPTPKDGEVLIKMESAPINPSDLAFLKGHYSSNKPFPCVPGFEGSGVVVASGGNKETTGFNTNTSLILTFSNHFFSLLFRWSLGLEPCE